MYWQRLLSFALLVLLHLDSAFGQPSTGEDASPHSSAELVSEAASVQPGQPFTLGLRMYMDEGWHSYWENPGDAGEATYIEWALSESFETGALQWPYPHRIDAGPLTSYGYSDEVILLTEITPPADLEPGETLRIDATAYWLICAEICLPAEESLSITLPVKSEAPATGPEAEAIALARAKLPASLDSWEVRAVSNVGSYVLQLTSSTGENVDLDGAYFFPAEYSVLEHAAPQPVSRDGDSYLIALQQSEYATEPAERLRGVLVAAKGQSWDDAENVHALAVDVAVEEAVMTVRDSEASLSLLSVMLLAFVGGMLLNLMPCVFPVLSIKILGFARQAQADHRVIRRHGLVFGVGVVASFLVLAGLLLALRASGSQIGWGFQLQSPFFVAAMTLLFFGIGLNLMGVFEMGAGLMRWSGQLEQKASKLEFRGSFFSGVLATVVATPCTAPFMGAALGAAIVLPAFQSLLIFGILGLGMAAPYVILSFAPRLLQRMPKPGAWMETLKHILAFPMFATSIWLVWVFGNQTGVDGVAFLLLGLLLFGLALWILGRWPAIGISTRQRLVTRSLALVAALIAMAAVYVGTGDRSALQNGVAREASITWEAFSPERIDRLIAEGRPVFVDFTAAWCLTCQVNKRTTLNAVEVKEAFRQKGVALFQADWTNQDPEISQAIESFGRSGVPLYVLYPGSAGEPILLPEILTKRIVFDALENIPDEAIL